MLIRYVGNRLHVIFHLSGVLFSLRPVLVEYFKSVCTNTSSLRTAILHVFSNPSILRHLKALGLLGNILTGPWMTVFYGNKGGKSNLEVVPDLKLVANLRHLANNPLSVLTVESDLFGHLLNPGTEDVLASLQNPVDPAQMKEFETVMKELIDGTITVLERQLVKYLSGDLSAPTPEMLLQTKSTPIHKTFSERVMGMTDSQTRRAPNATVGFIDATVKCAKNKPMNWLKQKSPQEQKKLVSFAIKRAMQVRFLRNKREDYKQKVFLKRQDAKKRVRAQAYRRNIHRPFKELVASDPEHLDEDKFNRSNQPEEKNNVVKDIISNKGSLINRYIDQYWFLDGEDYHGKILNFKNPKSGPYYNISTALD